MMQNAGVLSEFDNKFINLHFLRAAGMGSCTLNFD